MEGTHSGILLLKSSDLPDSCDLALYSPHPRRAKAEAGCEECLCSLAKRGWGVGVQHHSAARLPCPSKPAPATPSPSGSLGSFSNGPMYKAMDSKTTQREKGRFPRTPHTTPPPCLILARLNKPGSISELSLVVCFVEIPESSSPFRNYTAQRCS